MRFSVLLPTKNRLDLLRYAVDTVRRQSYADVEIVISDNCSEDDIAGFAASLGDPRVKYVRSPKPMVIAGGISPENVRRALTESAADGVDVNSGVESSPGVKDPRRLKMLFEELKRGRT